MFLYPFLNVFFLVLELSMSWHISVVEIEDDVIKRMPDRHWQCQKKGAKFDITCWLQILKNSAYIYPVFSVSAYINPYSSFLDVRYLILHKI